jgi:raffinose/stachyose/melibiose transport system substrate-binding protein
MLGGCSDDSGDDTTDGPTEVDFWHIGTNEPLKTIWAELSKAYETDTKNTIKATALENEAFKSKLTTVTQGGNPPHIFHSWGGGVLKEQFDAGLLKDISDEPWLDTFTKTSLNPYQINGKTYGIPFDLGMVGFWYNKDLFKKAGIDTPPATWTDFLGIVRKLKSAGVVPIALAGQDKWPAHFYWAYLAMRIGGVELTKKAAEDKKFDTKEFVQAGEKFKELIALDPFQKGFLAAKYDAPDGQAASVGNGIAAMELMGQWGPSTEASASNDKKGISDKQGFFPFPAVEGGKGKATDAFGGGNGYAIGKGAPKAAIEFAKFISTVDNHRKLVKAGAVLPVVKGAEDAITDANQGQVAKLLADATGFQLYLDQAYAPTVGEQIKDSVAELVAGKSTPEQVAKAIEAAAK